MKRPWLASGPLIVLCLGIAAPSSVQQYVYQLEGLAPLAPNQLALMVTAPPETQIVKAVDGRRLVKTKTTKDSYSSALMPVWPTSVARFAALLDVTEIAPGPHTLLIDISERGYASAAARTVVWEAAVARMYTLKVSYGKPSKGRFSWDAWVEDVTDTKDPPCVADPDQNHPRSRNKVNGQYVICFPYNPGTRVSK